MRNAFLYTALICAALIWPFAANASVVGDPTCAMELEIAHQEKGFLTGALVNVRALDFSGGFLGGDFCAQFVGKSVRVNGKGNYAELMMERAGSLTLGVQRGSTMGAAGPVEFIHWEIMAMQEGDTDVARDVFPAIEVILQED